jgi:hypothetical protein
MAKVSIARALQTKRANVAMLEIAWEMTKHYISVRPDTDITPQSLRDEFAKNLEAVYKVWSNLGDGKGGRS